MLNKVLSSSHFSGFRRRFASELRARKGQSWSEQGPCGRYVVESLLESIGLGKSVMTELFKNRFTQPHFLAGLLFNGAKPVDPDLCSGDIIFSVSSINAVPNLPQTGAGIHVGVFLQDAETSQRESVIDITTIRSVAEIPLEKRTHAYQYYLPLPQCLTVLKEACETSLSTSERTRLVFNQALEPFQTYTF